LERATKERTNGKSLFISKTQRKIETDAVALEFQKFLSYKNESGWVVLSKGSGGAQWAWDNYSSSLGGV
jgi:hypothetical protein